MARNCFQILKIIFTFLKYVLLHCSSFYFIYLLFICSFVLRWESHSIALVDFELEEIHLPLSSA